MSGETGHQTDVQYSMPTDGIKLMEGESVLQNRHPGWGLWWYLLLAATLLGLQGLGGLATGSGGFGAIILAAALVGYVVVARMQSRYIVTDERVKMDVGLIRNKSREYRISDLRGIDTEQNIVSRLFGIGDISVRTGDGSQITWRGVPEYEVVAQVIRKHQRKYDETMDRK